ncbi:hypothetical protein FKW77_001148 [Venturia effusa]|uniref:Amidase domain-containing protein n=1 Tax=Venturia effusa TaxID=50376 RepID=A0A517LNB2_9PEZI|nr:hypothetical protein FKW77_001148 [Venturia effusa]
MAATMPTDLMEASIEQLGYGLRQHQFTSVGLVKAYLLKIAEVNGELNAVLETNPDALSIAASLDEERADGKVRGPLHGIPILIKDFIATKDKLNTTGTFIRDHHCGRLLFPFTADLLPAGSYALLGAKVSHDATIVTKLRKAGAIILGKTNLSQWAHLRSFNTTNGWSARGGQTHGPYFPDQDPWGSSSGSAVSVALGLSAAALGTETDGSITYPASYNNIVGIKPTVGLTSRHMIISFSEHEDTVGPLARTVKDAAYLLQVISGVDRRDNYTSAIPDGVVPDFVSACKPSALASVRLGIPRNAISILSDNASRPMLEAFEWSVDVLRAAGATIIEDANFTAAVEYMNSTATSTVVFADWKMNLPLYLAALAFNPQNIGTLEDLRNFITTSPLEDSLKRDVSLMDLAIQSPPHNNKDPQFWEAYQKALYFGEEGGLAGAIERHQLDAVILPANFAPHWAASIGAPIITVPMGAYPAGTPMAKDAWGLVEVASNIPSACPHPHREIGKRFSEKQLVGMAYAFEQRTKFRDKLKPYVTPKASIEVTKRGNEVEVQVEESD